MLPGMVLLLVGYVLVYWGLGHFQGKMRYSFWTLLGIPNMPSTPPVQFKA